MFHMEHATELHLTSGPPVDHHVNCLLIVEHCSKFLCFFQTINKIAILDVTNTHYVK